MNKEAGNLASFLGKQGHEKPIVLILPPGHPHIKEWEGGCLQVWSADDLYVPLVWEDIPVLHVKKNIYDCDYLIEEEGFGGESDDN